MARKGGLSREERGATLVEFALVLPVILLLVFGMIEFGRVLNAQIVIRNAAREGARAGSVGKSAAEIAACVLDMSPTLDGGALSVAVTNAQGATGEAVVVHVAYSVDVVTPLIAAFFSSNPVPLAAESSMRLE